MLFKKMSLLAVALTLVLTACGSGSSDKFDASKVSCGDVSHELSNATSAYGEAQTKLKNADNERAKKKATEAEGTLHKKVGDLYKREEACKKGAAPSPSATPSTSCKGGGELVVKLPDRKGGRLNAAGVTKRGDAKAFKAQILDQAAHDPLTLFLYYQTSPLGKTDPLANESVLVLNGKIEDGNCYSAEGVRAYNEWAVLWKTTDVVAVPEITFQGNNTGVKGTSPTTAPGVKGKDKSGYDVTYKDAAGKPSVKHSALNRCTQPTTAKPPPNVPPGETDNGKDHRLSPVSSDPNDPDERVRPVVSAPPTVYRPPGSTPQPTTKPTMASDPPEVSSPQPAATQEPTAPATSDPADNCDKDGDGIPDDNC